MSEKIRGLGQMTIGGKTRPYQVNGLRQTRAFCEAMGIELDAYWPHLAKLSTNGLLSNQEILVAFVYSALFAGARKERLPVDFEYEDVVDWFEEADELEAEEFLKPVVALTELVQQAALQTALQTAQASPKGKKKA